MEPSYEILSNYLQGQKDFLRSLAKLRGRWQFLSFKEKCLLLYEIKSLVLLLHEFVNSKEEEYERLSKEYQNL